MGTGGTRILPAPWGHLSPHRPCPQDLEECEDTATVAGSAEPGVPDGGEPEKPDAEAEPGPCPDTPKTGQAVAGERRGGAVLAVPAGGPSLDTPLSLPRATNGGRELHQQRR